MQRRLVAKALYCKAALLQRRFTAKELYCKGALLQRYFITDALFQRYFMAKMLYCSCFIGKVLSCSPMRSPNKRAELHTPARSVPQLLRCSPCWNDSGIWFSTGFIPLLAPVTSQLFHLAPHLLMVRPVHISVPEHFGNHYPRSKSLFTQHNQVPLELLFLPTQLSSPHD